MTAPSPGHADCWLVGQQCVVASRWTPSASPASAVLPSLGDTSAGDHPVQLLLANALTDVADRLLELAPVRDLLQRESVVGWRPVAPLLLCGGDRDPVVPFANTTSAAADFSARGGNVSVVDVEKEPAFALLH